jgi:hypothetical protein
MPGDKKPTIARGDSGLITSGLQILTHRLPPKQQSQQRQK